MDSAGPGPGSTESFTRSNGRSSLQLRSLRCEKGILVRADGSAKWSQDKTSVLVGVYGPRQTIAFRENAEKATISVSVKSASGTGSAQDRILEQTLRKAAEGVILAKLHPRTLISITLQEIANDGSLLACSLNGMNAALIDAGIAMRCTLAAASCSLDSEKRLLLDPDLKEEEDAIGVVTTCHTARLLKPEDEKITLSPNLLAASFLGDLEVAEFLQLKEVTKKCSERISEFSRLSTAQTFA